MKSHHNELLINEHLNDPDHFLYFIKGLTCEGQGFLIMETALSDLVQRLDYSEFTNEDLHRLFEEILSSLLRLAELRVYHGDLHCGNVFFVMRNCAIKAVIGDFGESSFADSPTASSSDLFYFVNSLRQRLGSRSGPFILKLDLLFRFLGSTCGCSEDDFDRYLETDTAKREAAVIRCNVEFLQRVQNYWKSL
ncbi:MAG: protein kinase family protein [Nitrososphaerales archaeon]